MTTVKTILSEKGSEVVTISPTATLDDAIATLAQRRIGALVVLGADQRVIGILSERDIIRVLGERGAGALKEPLAQTMTRVVVTCGEDDAVSAVMEQMTHGRFRHVPVVEQDRLIGIISIGDVVKQRLGEMARESDALRDYIQTRRSPLASTPPPAVSGRVTVRVLRPRDGERFVDDRMSRNSRNARSVAGRPYQAMVLEEVLVDVDADHLLNAT
jgi:CBS domain-containing protein